MSQTDQMLAASRKLDEALEEVESLAHRLADADEGMRRRMLLNLTDAVDDAKRAGRKLADVAEGAGV